MLVEERRQKVLEFVKSHGFVALSDIAAAMEFSASTIRRDLEFWDQQGVLKRTHGGAMFTGERLIMPALEERTTTALLEKQQIAQAAVERIRDGDAVLLDGGTTTLEVARLLVGRSLQIVTNSLPIANLFAGSREADLVVLGGYLYPKTGVMLGPLAVRMMENIHVHQAILSVGGITGKGLFNSNLLLVETERQMMRCADDVVVVADHSKIGRQNIAFLCELDEIDTLIVDRGISPEQRNLVQDAGVKLIVADGKATGGMEGSGP